MGQPCCAQTPRYILAELAMTDEIVSEETLAKRGCTSAQETETPRREISARLPLIPPKNAILIVATDGLGYVHRGKILLRTTNFTAAPETHTGNGQWLTFILVPSDSARTAIERERGHFGCC